MYRMGSPARALVRITCAHGALPPASSGAAVRHSPDTTISCHTTCMRSSIPLTPLGILRKSLRPTAFWLLLNTAWSVATSCVDARARRCHGDAGLDP